MKNISTVSLEKMEVKFDMYNHDFLFSEEENNKTAQATTIDAGGGGGGGGGGGA